jgi:hypothetical protein
VEFYFATYSCHISVFYANWLKKGVGTTTAKKKIKIGGPKYLILK